MAKVLVTKHIEGEDKEFEVEVGPDNTVYLCEGESLVENPNGVKIHYPTKTTYIKKAIALIVVFGFLALGLAAFLASNSQ
jgi:hypothetical protein